MKDREGRKSWNGNGRAEKKDLIKKEIDKVAPLWIKNKPQDLNEIEDERLREEIINNDFNREFIWEELRRAIERGNDKSSPGLDGIDYKMLKNLSERFKKELLVFFNYAYRSGKMFKDWKENQTIFIEKKKKK